MRKFIIAAAVALCLSACGPKLVIIHTNDTHSHLEAIRGGDIDGRGGIIERAAIIDSLREKYGEDRVLLLHAGDFNQGTSYYTRLGGELEVEMVNALGYDCITIGNHEFDNGIEDLTARLSKLEKCQVVCANLDLSPFALGEIVKPCTVIERGGMRLGIVGVTSDIRTVVAAPISSRIPVYDNVTVINQWTKYLREEEKCDKVILLSHMGYHEDCETVPQLSGVDIVIGGHSHTNLDEFTYVNDFDGKTVPIITDGKWGANLGKIEYR